MQPPPFVMPLVPDPGYGSTDSLGELMGLYADDSALARTPPSPWNGGGGGRLSCAEASVGLRGEKKAVESTGVRDLSSSSSSSPAGVVRILAIRRRSMTALLR